MLLFCCWIVLLGSAGATTGCSHSASSKSEKDSSPAGTGRKDTDPDYRPAPEMRALVADSPVAQYQKRTDNPLNEWYFRVRLYETPRTFRYRLSLQYEEIRGEDTLEFPNFGRMPQPVIREGKEKYSCLIGFLDKDSVFREYKKVFVDHEKLQVVTLRHYTVYPVTRKADKDQSD